MKTFAITLGTVTLAVVLVTAGVWLGVNWTQDRWESSILGYRTDMMGGNWAGMPCGNEWGGSGMMGQNWSCEETYVTPGAGGVDSLEEAQQAFEDYVGQLGYSGLHVTEVMEFERNFYAIAADEDTGVGAMELLVDKASGAVGPEPGPNMMWNAQYGMMGRGGMMGTGMMGDYSTDQMVLSPDEARDVAQRWLEANLPGRSAGEPDPFPGYYTLHFLNDGEIEGMLSLHGGSGEVWYHSWHGDFVSMVGGHD